MIAVCSRRNALMESTPPAMPTLCRGNCGFYGSPSMDGLCSKCFKDSLKHKNDTGRLSPAQAAASTRETLPPCFSSQCNCRIPSDYICNFMLLSCVGRDVGMDRKMSFVAAHAPKTMPASTSVIPTPPSTSGESSPAQTPCTSGHHTGLKVGTCTLPRIYPGFF